MMREIVKSLHSTPEMKMRGRFSTDNRRYGLRELSKIRNAFRIPPRLTSFMPENDMVIVPSFVQCSEVCKLQSFRVAGHHIVFAGFGESPRKNLIRLRYSSIKELAQMSNEKQSDDAKVVLEKWGMRITLEFLGVDRMSDYARKRIEDDLFNALQEMGCEFDGNGFISWQPDPEGLLATGEDC